MGRVAGFILLAWFGGALVAQQRTFDLREQVRDAEIIVVADVVSVHELKKDDVQINSQSIPALILDADIHVLSTLKGGPVPANATVRFTMPITPAGSVGYHGPTASARSVLFLRRSDDRFQLANAFNPVLPAITASPENASGEPLAEVLSELASVLDSPRIRDQFKLALIYDLGNTPDPGALTILKRHLHDSDFAVSSAVAAALIQQGDLSGLEKGQQILVAPPKGVPNYLLVNLSSAIARYVKDERTIPLLSTLLKAPGAESRRAAALALRNTRSQNVIPSLIYCLNDDDIEVRYYGVIGLGEITNQPEWRPLMDDFVSQERKYLQYWRAWGARYKTVSEQKNGS
ncbi:MAG TPA: HEAT repeat domain-containing protein [Terriglobales bacterium]|nr:HEAT repeat domain-containing protein [Terriglobales bacterium]